MKKIDFTMHFSAVQQSLDRVFKDMLAFQTEYLQELFARNDTVTVDLLTERRNIKNGMVNFKDKSYPVIKTRKNYNHNYKDKYVEFPLPLADLALMKDFAMTSEEVRHEPDMFNLNWLNVPYKEWYKYEDEHRPIEKQHGLFKLGLAPSADGSSSVAFGHYF